MSETYSEIVFYDDNKEVINGIKNLFDDSERMLDEVGSYDIEEQDIFDNGMRVRIVGGSLFNTDSLISVLRSWNPRYLLVENDFTQVAEKEKIYLVDGQKSTKKKVISGIRRQSKQLDLYFALINKQYKKVEQLLQDEQLNLDTSGGGIPILFYLFGTMDLELMKLALLRGADINETINNTTTVTINCGDHNKYVEAIKGSNLLHIAIKAELKKEFNLFLIKAGINVNQVDEQGNAPINLAAEFIPWRDMVTPLVKAGANINHEGKDGYTPLFTIISFFGNKAHKNAIRIIKKYTDLGADIHHVSKNGVNAMWAVRDNPNMIDLVGSYGIDSYRIPDDYYDMSSLGTRLHQAIDVDDSESFDSFLDVDKLDIKRQARLLHHAVEDNRLEITKLIIENGISPRLKNHKGQNAYEAINDRDDRVEIAAYLRSQMSDYIEECEKRISLARNVYDPLIATLERIAMKTCDKKNIPYDKFDRIPRKDIIGIDVSELDEYAEHTFMNNGAQRGLWNAILAAFGRPHGEKITTTVDDEFTVTFRCTTNCSHRFEVIISTKDRKPDIELITW